MPSIREDKDLFANIRKKIEILNTECYCPEPVEGLDLHKEEWDKLTEEIENTKIFIHQAGYYEDIRNKLSVLDVNNIWGNRENLVVHGLFTEIKIKDLVGKMPR